jgi:putative membrane protein
LKPQLLGVPVTVVVAWPAIVYLAYRVALLVAPAGLEAAALAAVLATALDVPTDPHGVREGVWRYPESAVSEPRFYGVPWWNFLGWLVIVFATAMLPALVG